jgi:uncharacterized protein (TIGR03382 family)
MVRVVVVMLLVARVASAAPSDTPPAPVVPVAHILYLDRCTSGCTITKSTIDDARRSLSTVPEHGGLFTLDPLVWTDEDWAEAVQCVREVYSPYAVEIVEQRPPDDALYNMAVVAGEPAELGLDGGAGVSSSLGSDCAPLSNTISFVFGNNPSTVGNVDWLCWAITHETGHAFGLDHAFMFADGSSACRDPMSYRSDCGGQRFFRPDVATCGEFAPRACACGGGQSAHYQLLGVLGPATPITAPPVVAMALPTNGESRPGPFDVVVDASAQRGVAALHVYYNGTKWTDWPGAQWGPDGQASTRYSIAAPQDLPDGIVDISVEAADDIGIATRTPSVTITRGDPCVDATTCARGQRCDAGRCLWDPPAGDFGDECRYPQFCKSGVCLAADGNAWCSDTCSPDVADSCPDGWECRGDYPHDLCYPVHGGGCCSSGGGTSSLVFGLALLWWLGPRRRRLVPRSRRDRAMRWARAQRG